MLLTPFLDTLLYQNLLQQSQRIINSYSNISNNNSNSHSMNIVGVTGQSQQFGGFHMGHDPKRMLPTSQREHRDKNIKIILENRDLWTKFHSLGTEMIITKTGRLVT